MNMNILSAFVLGLALSASAVAESLPVIAVKPHAVDLTFPSEAVVEAIQQATVGAQVPGRVLEVKADAGQTVKKGDVLMRIDGREAAEAEARATQMVSDSIQGGNVQAINYFVAQKYIDALGKLASANNSKVILMPLEASQVIGAVGGIGEIVKATFDNKKG